MPRRETKRRKGVFTPNDQHYVSWHWANFPGDIDVDSFRLTVHGQVKILVASALLAAETPTI